MEGETEEKKGFQTFRYSRLLSNDISSKFGICMVDMAAVVNLVPILHLVWRPRTGTRSGYRCALTDGDAPSRHRVRCCTRPRPSGGAAGGPVRSPTVTDLSLHGRRE